jgi:hypothetical protein
VLILPPSESSVAAFHLLADLETYEQHVQSLVERGWDPALYMASSQVFEQLRLHAAGLPQVRVAWMDVLITRFEVAAVLLDLKDAPRPDPLLAESHAVHARSIDTLRTLVRRLCMHPDA